MILILRYNLENNQQLRTHRNDNYKNNKRNNDKRKGKNSNKKIRSNEKIKERDKRERDRIEQKKKQLVKRKEKLRELTKAYDKKMEMIKTNQTVPTGQTRTYINSYSKQTQKETINKVNGLMKKIPMQLPYQNMNISKMLNMSKVQRR